MIRERTLKIVLLVVGLLFLIGVYGLIGRVPPADQMLGLSLIHILTLPTKA